MQGVRRLRVNACLLQRLFCRVNAVLSIVNRVSQIPTRGNVSIRIPELRELVLIVCELRFLCLEVEACGIVDLLVRSRFLLFEIGEGFIQNGGIALQHGRFFTCSCCLTNGGLCGLLGNLFALDDLLQDAGLLCYRSRNGIRYGHRSRDGRGGRASSRQGNLKYYAAVLHTALCGRSKQLELQLSKNQARGHVAAITAPRKIVQHRFRPGSPLLRRRR